MKCAECLSLIEEYIDGELSQAVTDNVEKHIGGCKACARVAEDLRAEQQLYATYEPALEVTPQLWTGIEARIGEQDRVPGQGRLEWLRSFFATAFTVPRFSGWATAALVLIAIGATAIFMKYTERQQSPVPAGSAAVTEAKPTERPTAPTIATASVPAVSASPNTDRALKPRQPAAARSSATAPRVPQMSAIKTPNQLVQEAEQKYIMAIAMLSRDASRKRSQIDGATRARLDQAIASIDRTIAGTRQAVRQHPGDPVAVQYMLAAYARKVDLLRDIAAQ